jgi:hypothetical protein
MPLILQDRDIIIFQELGVSGFLSLDQVARLAFGGNLETARKRIGKLMRADLLAVETIPFSRLKILRLTSRSAEASRKIGLPVCKIPKLSRSSSLLHDLAVRDVRLAFLQTIGDRVDVAIDAFEIEQANLRFRCPGTELIPDGFISLHFDDGSVSDFFLEIDRGTEDHGRLLAKIRSYDRLLKSGVYARWRNVDTHPRFKVIFIFDSIVRAQAFKKSVAEEGVMKLALSITRQEIIGGAIRLEFLAGRTIHVGTNSKNGFRG